MWVGVAGVKENKRVGRKKNHQIRKQIQTYKQ